MIDESILEQVIPLPSEEEKMQEIQKELVQAGFVINNFNKGGIFYTLIRICVKIGIEIKQLARTILNSCFTCHAEGEWMILKAADYGAFQKPAVKAQGFITIYRNDFEEPLLVSKGHMFKTLPDLNGRELKYYVKEDTLIDAGSETGRVLVEAEKTGTDFNVSAGKISVSMIHLSGVSHVSNDDGWLYKEGAEQETIESLRSRTMEAWEEVAERTTDDKLKCAAKSVPGVLNVEIDSQHPRGQGTVDIIVTGAAGEATAALLAEVRDAVDYLRGNYDDFLCKSAIVIRQDIALTLFLAKNVSHDGIKEQAEHIIENLLKLNERQEMNCLYLDEIRVALSEGIPDYRRVDIAEPSADMELSKEKVILLGELKVAVANVGGGESGI